MKEELSQINSKHVEKRKNLQLEGKLQQVKNVLKTFCEKFECPELQLALEETPVGSNEAPGAAGAAFRSRGGQIPSSTEAYL